MSKILDGVLKANEGYAASFGEKGSLARSPVRHFAVLTCMDARLDPSRFAGLAEGDANIIRNAGGRASDDAIRSLVISWKLLGTREFFVIHHTDCGLVGLTNDRMNSLLAASPELTNPMEAEFIDWLTIKEQAQSVISDVSRIRAHPLVPRSIPIYGYIYDVHTGRLTEVPGARAAGQAA